ncbi:sensor histidine kinase [Actinocorallia longicatena]
MGRRLTVRQWFLVIFAVIGALVATASVLGGLVLSRTATSTDHLVDDLTPARIEALRLQSAQLDQETGLRGYILTGEADALTPYRQGIENEKKALLRLDELIGHEDGLGTDLDAVTASAAAWRRDYAEPMIATVRAKGTVSATTSAAGKSSFDGLRATWDVQNRHLTEEVRAARDDLSEMFRIRNIVFAAMPIAFLLAAFLVLLILNYAVGRPLAALRDSSRRVASGEFDHAIEGRGPADLRSLAADVEAMRARIVTELGGATDRERVLDDQAAELRRSNAELEQFAYVASHDLQEPLRKVVSFCQMIERRYADKLDDRGLQYIGFAVDGASRMQVLINDLLAFSRVGRLNDEKDEVPLGETLAKAIDNLSTTIEESGARVTLPDDLPAVHGNRTLLTQLWQNLIGNSIKFRSGPEPSVTVEWDGASEFTVTDDGIGIDPEFSDKIFVIFQRLHTRDAYTGTGIGLALCKKIVEHHGGVIRLDPSYTGGTRIRFTLPEGTP